MSQDKHDLQRQADRTKPKNNARSVLVYLVILFTAAVILLLFAYLMQNRSNEQDTDGLKQPVSMQNAQELYEENAELKEQLEQMEQQAEAMQSQLDQLQLESQTRQQQVDSLERTAQAMDWFWQINEAYVRGRHTLARQLIEQMGTELPQYLPMQSITDNGRFSPYDRYQEIYDALY